MSVSTSREPAKIAGMFDGIARRYDTLNHLLSAGLDRRWRRQAIRALELGPADRMLDMCTGTGDLAVEAVTHAGGAAGTVIGIDFSHEMLRLGLDKVRSLGLAGRISGTTTAYRIVLVEDATGRLVRTAPADAREWARQARFLQGRGFAIETIRRLLRDMPRDMPE